VTTALATQNSRLPILFTPHGHRIHALVNSAHNPRCDRFKQSVLPRRDGRVAEGARLESVYTARYPGFESLSLRQSFLMLAWGVGLILGFRVHGVRLCKILAKALGPGGCSRLRSHSGTKEHWKPSRYPTRAFPSPASQFHLGFIAHGGRGAGKIIAVTRISIMSSFSLDHPLGRQRQCQPGHQPRDVRSLLKRRWLLEGTSANMIVQ
jgi:hypothetical protein